MNIVNRNSFLLLLILITSTISLNAQTKVIKKPNLPKVENSISEYISVDTILSFTDEIPITNSLINWTWKDELIFTNFNIHKSSDTITIYRQLLKIPRFSNLEGFFFKLLRCWLRRCCYRSKELMLRHCSLLA